GIRVPVPPTGHGYAYEKLKRKIGDYATAAAAVILSLNGGNVASCSIGLTNVAEMPLWAVEAAKILTGSALDAATVKKAVAAAEGITSPADDARGPSHYRTKMAGVMLTRALARAKKRARGWFSGGTDAQNTSFHAGGREGRRKHGGTPHPAPSFPARAGEFYRVPFPLA